MSPSKDRLTIRTFANCLWRKMREIMLRCLGRWIDGKPTQGMRRKDLGGPKRYIVYKYYQIIHSLSS